MYFTLNNILQQENINYEIIICDDGSKDNLAGKIKEFFLSRDFVNYTIVANPVNKGTLYNLISGLNIARGEFIKTTSPGDGIYGKDTLRRWVDYCKQEDLQWSFSDAIYYTNTDGKFNAVSVNANPNDIEPYIRKNIQECRWNYLVLNDIALGAAILSKKNIQLEYCNRIKGKVIYAEDNIWRMMMFDGIVGGYFDNTSVLYEYGTGISTGNNDIWKERLTNDWNHANQIMLDLTNDTDKIQEKIKREILREFSQYKFLKIIEKIGIKNFLKFRLMIKFKPRLTSAEHNIPIEL